MTPITRRQLLQLAAAACVPGVASCSLEGRRPVAVCPNDQRVDDKTSPLLIDVHAHVFNATDLPVERFLTLVASRQHGGVGDVWQAFAAALQDIAWHKAPLA